MTARTASRRRTTISPHRALVQRRMTVGDGHRIKQRRFYLHTFDEDHGWQPCAALPHLTVQNGGLALGGIEVVRPELRADQLYFRQHARDAQGTHYLAGQLFLHSNGIDAHGTINFGDSEETAVRYEVLATTIATAHYTTRLTTGTYPQGTDPATVPASDWAPGLALEIGFRQQIGNTVPTPVVILDGQDLSEYARYRADDRYTYIDLTLDDVACSFLPDCYRTTSLAFEAAALDPVGKGYVEALCSAPKGRRAAPNVRLWEATSALMAQEPAPLRTPMQMLSMTDSAANLNELVTILPDEVVSDDANAMLMRNMKWAMGQDPTQRKWLADFFGETPPVISEPGQQALVRQGIEWYQKKFSKAYLTKSFNTFHGPNEPQNRLPEDKAKALDDFLKSGLAKDKDFNTQHQGIYVDAYIGCKPALSKYINDTTSEVVGWAQTMVVFTRMDTKEAVKIPAGTIVETATGVKFSTADVTELAAGIAESPPVLVLAMVAGSTGLVAANAINIISEDALPGYSIKSAEATTLAADSGGLKWAKKLFTALTSGSTFVLMVNRVSGATGDSKALGPVNNFSCLLTALDRSGTLASSYFHSVLSGVVIKLIPSATYKDKETVMEWLPSTLQEILRKLAHGELPDQQEISAAEGQQMFDEYLKHKDAVDSAMGDLFVSTGNAGVLDQARKAEAGFSSFAERWPRLAKMGKLMVAIGWIGGVASVVMSITKGEWKKMNAKDKATFVTTCVQLGVSGFKVVPMIWQGVKSIVLSVWTKLCSWWNQAFGRVISQQANALGNAERVVEQVAANVSAEMGASASGWARVFGEGLFRGVLKVVGAIAAAAMAAYSLWQLISDVNSDKPITTIVFDSLIFAVNFLSAVCIIVDLFVATSWIPIAGAILAIAGIIIGFLSGFFDKPESPLEVWMRDIGIPFAGGLSLTRADHEAEAEEVELQLALAWA
jgi:hypothetical protein